MENMNQQSGLYEGTEPYVFISYSHKNEYIIREITEILGRNHIRFWYDNGLHSGKDWNAQIAQHLDKAYVCVLLLSRAAAESTYVKNELVFAVNHRIPVHTVILEKFPIPSDIEILIGRIEAIERKAGYEKKLVSDLPPEVSEMSGDRQELKIYEHPLYEIQGEASSGYRTVYCVGVHRKIGYPVMVLREEVSYEDREKAEEQERTAGILSHPLFPAVLDYHIEGTSLFTYTEYISGKSIREYLEQNRPDETLIRKWIKTVVSGMQYLLQYNLALHEYSDGSVFITDTGEIRIIKLHNTYYGVFRVRADNKQYYINRLIQETAVLLYRLCTGELPVFPFRIIRESHVSNGFLSVANLIIQQSSGDAGARAYSSLQQIADDIDRKSIGIADRVFLSKREKKLSEYGKALEESRMKFTDMGQEDILKFNSGGKANSIEEKFGFDSTMSIAQDTGTPFDEPGGKLPVRIMVCDNGTIAEFHKDEVIVGRDERNCDLFLNQKTISRKHCLINRNMDGTYTVTDLASANGTTTDIGGGRRIIGSEILPAGTVIFTGDMRLKLME